MNIDCHIHISLDGTGRALKSEEDITGNITRAFREYKKRGILAVRDGGDNLGIAQRARDIACDIGVIYKTPIFSFYKKGCYGGFTGKPVENNRDFKALFNKWIEKKPDHMKIIFTGIVDFNTYGKVGGIAFSYDDLYFMIQSARDKGLSAMVHANTSEGVRLAVKAGADTIEHGYYLTEEELHMMKDENVIWVPTLSPLGNLLTKKDPKYASQLPVIKKIFDSQALMVKKAHEIGVKIAVGSDAGAYGVHHGQGFYDETGYFKMAGVNYGEAIKMAFENGAKALGIPRNIDPGPGDK